MRAFVLLLIGIVTVLWSIAIACSDVGDTSRVVTGSNANGGEVGSGGMVRPNTFLTFGGERYELVNMLQGSLVDRSEFSAIGEASQADIKLGSGMQVYERQGRANVIYTLSPATEDDSDLWLQWRKAG